MDFLKKAHGEVGWFFWAMVALAFIWLFTGGTKNQSAHEGAYIKPLAPVDSGDIYGKYFEGNTPDAKNEKLDLPQGPANFFRSIEKIFTGALTPPNQQRSVNGIEVPSPLTGKLLFDGIAGAKSSDPAKEYIRIIASSKATGPITISGLVIKGSTKTSVVVIPKAIDKDIVLNPGDRAIISTGISPVGTSFPVSACSGYLNEKATFTPALRMDCPDGSDCRMNAASGMTYSACIDAHIHDADFYTNEWRIFLGKDAELWKDAGDYIQLLDANGRVVDTLSY